jgi:hypothetical protein
MRNLIRFLILSASSKMLEESTLSDNKRLCECGCGQQVFKFSSRFKKGHNIRQIRAFPEYTSNEVVVCRICKSNKTFLRKRKKTNGIVYFKPDWYEVNRKKGTAICSNCYNRVINGDYVRLHAKFRIKYKNRYVYLKYNPRIGVCNWCRGVAPFDTAYTELHHDERRYDDNNPLRNTIELCKSCHQREKGRLGELKLKSKRKTKTKIQAQTLP